MTQWTYHSATGLEWSKIYADGSSEQKTYDAFNRLSTITDARGVVKTHTYDVARELLLSDAYSDEKNNRIYLYNFLAMPVQISDDVRVKNLVYNSFNELEVREGCKPSYKDHPCLWLITWAPTQPVATRPLAIPKDGTWYTYGWNLTKNICEIFGQNGYIRSTYAYTPFGAVTASGDVNQPIQWSSEYYNNDLALVYYNYRHYNPTEERWINRDPIAEQGGWNLYGFLFNMSINSNDYIGKWKIVAKIPPSNKNTIITDGQGGIIPYLKAVRPKEKGCLLKCFEIHENVHIQDALNDFRKRKIIIPKKKNQLVVHSHFAELVLSEVKAYSCEISCLKQISGDKCKKIAQARVEHLEEGLIRFKKIGNLLIKLVKTKKQKRPENELEIIRKKIKVEETYLRNNNYII